MLKDLVEYTDIDGKTATMTVFFHLTRYEVDAEMELEVLQQRFQEFMDEVIGKDPDAPPRDLTGPEKREMFNLIKTIIRHAYGRREGKLMIKNQEVWDEFEQSGAFSAYIYKLFASENGAEANKFMQGIWPAGLERSDEAPPASLENVPDAPDETKDDKGFQFMENLEDYSDDYLETCSQPEFDAIVNHFMSGRNIPFRLLVIGGKRTSGSETE